MAEIWLSREQVQRLMPVICRIGALLREITEDVFEVTFVKEVGE